MATGTWEDFTDKYGFSDGEGVEQRDFEARARLVEMLNEHEAMKAAGLRALEYDRPGLHNPCLVVVVKGQAEATRELLKLWLARDLVTKPRKKSTLIAAGQGRDRRERVRVVIRRETRDHTMFPTRPRPGPPPAIVRLSAAHRSFPRHLRSRFCYDRRC